ncbi:MAG: 7-carboxy-7-deazaguanine synthase QueE [Cyanobacterium sp. T60_A2020_053]|nr:7-carboxy-7-deazaguanine synthase QueE [Cyanobacterium sp. T60_A2020_053]
MRLTSPVTTTSDNLTREYPLVETFHSVQGEGFWHGVNAFFIRLAGCDVFCPWCDQKETWTTRKYPSVSVAHLVEIVKGNNTNIIIITGGEPLIHDLNPLTTELAKLGKRLHLETSGAHPFSGHFDWVTFSPKVYKKPHASIYDQVGELKVVISDASDLVWAENQGNRLQSGVLKYLQPEWDSPLSKDLIFEYIKNHPQWRLSLQTHKFFGVR